MKFTIKHDVPGRIRVHMDASSMTFIQADTLQYYLKNLHGVTNAKVYERTADAVVEYRCSRKTVIEAIAKFRYSNVEVMKMFLQHQEGQLIHTILKSWQIRCYGE